MTETYGFFDGSVKRDVVPDARLNKKMLGVVVFTVMRPVVGPLVLWNDWELTGGASEWDVTMELVGDRIPFPPLPLLGGYGFWF